MLFNSIEYMIFLFIVVCFYYFSAHKYRAIFLLIASYIMYISWIPKDLLIVLGLTGVSYLTARILNYVDKIFVKKIILSVGIIGCAGCLIIFKYLNFFINVCNDIITDKSAYLNPINLISPVGLSFFTLQAIGYMIDIYRGKYYPEKNYIIYSLFMSFFPQMAAGPIARGSDLIPQYRSLPKKVGLDTIKNGLYLILIGCFKKIVLADALSLYVNGVYGNLADVSGFSVFFAIILYSMQIYFDFSGYSDIAIGSAQLFGIDLMVNFNIPYVAVTFKEFWGRWHISLSSWFKDYIYIPLGGGKKGKIRKLLNVLIIFIISGLWHGAAWTFVIWGLLHGVYRVLEEIFENKKINNSVKRIFVFACVSIAWIFFRAENLNHAYSIIKALGNNWSVVQLVNDFKFILNNATFASVIWCYFYLITVSAALYIVLKIDFTCVKNNIKNSIVILEKWKNKKLLVYYMGMTIIFYYILGNGIFSQAGQFIYFNF